MQMELFMKENGRATDVKVCKDNRKSMYFAPSTFQAMAYFVFLIIASIAVIFSIT
jgi:hypothetical protein